MNIATKQSINYLFLIFLYVYCFSILLYMFFYIDQQSLIAANDLIFIVNIIYLIFFYTVILFVIYHYLYSFKFLIVISFVFCYIFVSLNYFLFIIYTSSVFEFTGSDSYNYHFFASQISNTNIISGLNNFLKFTKYGFDDSGFVLYLSIAYSILDSIYLIRLLNILYNALTIYLLYQIATYFIPKHLSFIATITYGISSFSIYYQSSGLKDTIMVLLIVLSFYYYYLYIIRRKLIFVFLFLLIALLLLFFRIPLTVFILTSVFISHLLHYKFNISTFVISILTFSVSLFIASNYHSELIRYTKSYNTTLRTESGIEKPTPFFMASAILAGIYGPLPTVIPTYDKRDTAMHAPSLILKSFLTSFFIFGIYFVFKYKYLNMLPLLLFSYMHIISLSYLAQTFKLRNQLPHFPFFIIVSFFSLGILSYSDRHPVIRQICNVSFVVISALIFFWNYLRF